MLDSAGSSTLTLQIAFSKMYPLRFQPAFRRYIWGGRRLADVLSKLIGDQSAAESWEIVDHGDDQSIAPVWLALPVAACTS